MVVAGSPGVTGTSQAPPQRLLKMWHDPIEREVSSISDPMFRPPNRRAHGYQVSGLT